MSRTYIRKFASVNTACLADSISKYQIKEDLEILSLSTFICVGDTWPYQALVVFERPIQLSKQNKVPPEVERPPINYR